jgi:hypothetical protein
MDGGNTDAVKITSGDVDVYVFPGHGSGYESHIYYGGSPVGEALYGDLAAWVEANIDMDAGDEGALKIEKAA